MTVLRASGQPAGTTEPRNSLLVETSRSEKKLFSVGFTRFAADLPFGQFEKERSAPTGNRFNPPLLTVRPPFAFCPGTGETANCYDEKGDGGKKKKAVFRSLSVLLAERDIV